MTPKELSLTPELKAELLGNRRDRFEADIGPLPSGLGGWLARVADRASNHADRRDLPFHPALEAMLPDGALLADLHADTLLWGVDPWRRRESGHTDLPRLFDARVGLQVFGGPTWTPLPMKNSEQALCVSCESIDQSNALFPSELIDRARRSRGVMRRRRAYRLAERFQDMLQADATGRLRPIYTPNDLNGLRTTAMTPESAPLGVMLSLEGLHWVEPDASLRAIEAEINLLKAAGYRMIAPTHRFSNGLGGSSEDCHGRKGLTDAGRNALTLCFNAGIAVDLAHAAPAMIRDAAGVALNQPGGPRPLIVSHAGVRAAHRQARNLRDADIRLVASTGGVIGVGVWWEAIGFELKDSFEIKIDRIVDAFASALAALRHPDFAEEMVDRYGHYDPYEHLAIGSDFDGAVSTPFDVSGLSWLLAALAARLEKDGAPLFPADKLRLLAGENSRRTLKRAMGGKFSRERPGGDDHAANDTPARSPAAAPSASA
ncbi:MAG: membrane dipeptidase [Rhodobacteraceae bacterium]|nr:membrane dipeptidase [Paracoccaceae bacterium]